MNDLQRKVKAVQEDLAAGRITVDDARSWAIDFAKLIGKEDVQAGLNVMLIALGTTDEKFLEFINGLTAAMLERE